MLGTSKKHMLICAVHFENRVTISDLSSPFEPIATIFLPPIAFPNGNFFTEKLHSSWENLFIIGHNSAGVAPESENIA